MTGNPPRNNVADILWQQPQVDVEILSMSVQQSISQPFEIRLEVKSSSRDLSFSDMLNQDAVIAVRCGADLTDDKRFCGVITRFRQKRTRHGNLAQATRQSYLYDVTLRPRMWRLSRQFRSRVFQNATVRDIASTILDEHGVSHNWEIEGELLEREYCVQYEETDYDFISRLLEFEGICFFFNQDEDQVVFSNHPGGHPDCQPSAQVQYIEEVSPRVQRGRREYIRDFTYEEFLGTGRWVMDHYRADTSSMDLEATAEQSDLPFDADLEHYAHSQNYPDASTGQRLADLRAEQEHGVIRQATGQGSVRGLTAGHVVEMQGHFRSDMNGRWLLTSCAMTAEQGSLSCYFTARPAADPYRPPCRTRKPKVNGIQTAVVTGPNGSPVYLDSLGRCKLQFHWDREGEHNDRSSMWVRVSQGYAGKNYGHQWIPRVGHEVLVAFVNGDPDQPVVVGRAYNDVQTPPLGPAQKHQNIIKTPRDNHILFDDQEGKERVEIRAQRNMTRKVMAQDNVQVGGNREVQVRGWEARVVKESINDFAPEIYLDAPQAIRINSRTIRNFSSLHETKSNRMRTSAESWTVNADNLRIRGGGFCVQDDIVMIQASRALVLSCGASSIWISPDRITFRAATIREN